MNRPRGPNLAVDHDHVVCMIIVILLTARHGCIGPVFQMLIRRIAVKRISLIVAAAAAISMAGVATGFAAELPTFEANGLPISAVQVAVLGAATAGHISALTPPGRTLATRVTTALCWMADVAGRYRWASTLAGCCCKTSFTRPLHAPFTSLTSAAGRAQL